MQQVEEAARYSEGKNSIVHPPPSTNDPIDDPRVISPGALNNTTLPIVFEGEQRATPLQAGETSDVSSASPVRILSRKVVSHSSPSASNLGGVLAPEFEEMVAHRLDAQNIGVLSGRVVPRADIRNGNVSALGIPNLLTSSSQSDPTGILTDKPISQWLLPSSIFGFSNRSGSSGSDLVDWPAALVGHFKGSSKSPATALDAGAPAAPSVPSNEFRSPDRRSSLGGASDAFSPDTPGGLASRIVALAGTVPANSDPRAAHPQENGLFYNDGLPQPWLLRALTGRLDREQRQPRRFQFIETVPPNFPRLGGRSKAV
jgi:hypothetical protein